MRLAGGIILIVLSLLSFGDAITTLSSPGRLSKIIFSLFLLAAGVVVIKRSNKAPTGSIKKCPFCAENIKAEAVVCKHCGRDLPKDEIQQASSPYEFK